MKYPLLKLIRYWKQLTARPAIKSEPWRFKMIHSVESKKSFATFISETYKKKAGTFLEVKYNRRIAIENYCQQSESPA